MVGISGNRLFSKHDGASRFSRERLNDNYASAVALFHAQFAAHFEADVAEVERLALELNCPQGSILVNGGPREEVFGGWARACGSPAEGIAWIEEAIGEWKAPGSTLVVPYWLALKAEALQFAGRLSEALDAVQEAEALAKASGDSGGLLNCIGCKACF